MHLPRLAPTSLTEERGWRIWAGFGGVFVVLAIVHAVKGDADRWGVVSRDYWPATRTWWAASGDLYTEGIAGFLYLPQSIWLFTPFAYLPFELDQILWRLFGLALVAVGLRRLARHALPSQQGAVFAWASVLSLFCAFSATNTGQTNLHLVGFMLQACADVIEKRWTRAAVWLWLGMLAKPIALVLILLCAALKRELRWKLLVGAVVFAVLPFVHWDPAYASEQYGLAFQKLERAGQPGEKLYVNLYWLLRTVGLQIPESLRMPVAAVFALATLAACRLGFRRRGAVRGAWLMTALAACYMVLLSPRTETNTYVILAPFVALSAAVALFLPGRRAAFFSLAAGALALGSDNYGRGFHALTQPWLKPLVAVLYAAWLLWPRRAAASAEAGAWPDPSRVADTA